MRYLAGEDLPRLWEMLAEFPQFTHDDSGPESLAEFEQIMADRAGRETHLAFEVAGELAGAIAFEQMTRRSAMLRGLCFAKDFHGTGIPLEAVRGVIEAMYRGGAEKISAQMFADNERAWRFFQKLGAVEEGLLREHATRAGELVDVRVIALFRKKAGA